jgi:hypothetical protein
MQLKSAPKDSGGVPLHPCSVVTSGSIGPLPAPYRQCAISTSEGQIVRFTATGDMSGHGLAYTDVGATTFEDECSRHLVGKWWMFDGNSNQTGTCPFGYQFRGGG